MRSPQWKVYDADNKYVASTKDTEGASLLMSLYGIGATIRYDHRQIVWTEGVDGIAQHPYDIQTKVITERLYGGLLLKTGGN